MSVSFARLRATLAAFDWNEMFVELGWSRTRQRPDQIAVDQHTFTLAPVAELGGMLVYRCTTDAGVLPPSALRRKLENKIKDQQFEHIIIFEDGARHQAVFQWIKRGEGAAKSREFAIERTARGELLRGEQLLQRLSGIAFDFNDLDAEGQIGIGQVVGKVSKSLDVESVTKRFYDEFTKQRDAFQTFLRGIPHDDDQRWYVSVMLNRLMFIYFIQSKRFLDNDGNYLQHNLQRSQERGHDLFFRDFLQVLFFKGFAQPKAERDVATQQLLGNVPYLNGGLFLPHQIEERYGAAITIPDAAFSKLFEFFGKWRWHLNERPGHSEREIDPDVLGYIFEKYINQKQMGAYYTKDDITGYICRNTIIPALWDKADLSLDLLDLPRTIESYIYPAVRQSERLPTETDREYAARHQRKEQLIADGRAGKIATINDAITANLNLEAMAFDLVPFLGARELWNLLNALNTLSVLDPTCGSGAFLFAAIKILKPLYEQALDRMALLVERRKTEGFAFRQILDAEQQHANRDYFITKSIVVRNLYGVDIMEEATEVCKLRLFLRLVADLNDEDAGQIEPLPDIDFNIRAGNALVGYAAIDEIGGVVKQGGLLQLNPRQQRLLEDVQTIQHGLSAYRQTQLQYNPSGEVFRRTRQEIRDKLREVDAALDDDLLRTGQITRDGDGYNTQPFHWFTAFYDILHNGGFDVIVGNPPYVSVSKIDYKLPGPTTKFSDIYAHVLMRTLGISSSCGRLGMIVPLSVTFSEDFGQLRRALSAKGNAWFSSYDNIPASVFAGVSQRCTIWLGAVSEHKQTYTSPMYRWRSPYREALMSNVSYTDIDQVDVATFGLPKLADDAHARILNLIKAASVDLPARFVARNRDAKVKVGFSQAARNFISVFLDDPPCVDAIAFQRVPSSKIGYVNVRSVEVAHVALAMLAGDTYYWYWLVRGDGFDVTGWIISDFLLAMNGLSAATVAHLAAIGNILHQRRFEALVFKKNAGKYVGNYNYRWLSPITRRADLLLLADLKVDRKEALDVLDYVQRVLSINESAGEKSIPRAVKDQFAPVRVDECAEQQVLDEIDRVLAQHYGFTAAELEFIINYDIKYRMGRDAEDAAA